MLQTCSSESPGVLRAQLQKTFLDPDELSDPIGRLVAEHYRAHVLCRALYELADAPCHPGYETTAYAVRHYLAHELPIHIADELEDLMPLLQRRRPTDLELDEIYVYLSQRHQEDAALAEELIPDLSRLASGGMPRVPLRFVVNLRSLARTMLKHLSWENSVVLPLARQHLTRKDLATLDLRMVARHEAA
ncbi:MAG: hemerythrin domain-containing protein [Alphaproteobacteria bacterium]|nr:hemerythrin domain-containing protein [Alphaproteobacteria bacterium]